MAAKTVLAIDDLLRKLRGEVPHEQWATAFALFEAAFAVAVHGRKAVPAQLAKSAISWQTRRSKRTAGARKEPPPTPAANSAKKSAKVTGKGNAGKPEAKKPAGARAIADG